MNNNKKNEICVIKMTLTTIEAHTQTHTHTNEQVEREKNLFVIRSFDARVG